MTSGSVRPAPAAADHRRGLLPGARVAGAAQDRLLPRPHEPCSADQMCTRWRSRPRSRSGAGRASTSCPTASCGATTTSTTSLPGSPASRSPSRPRISTSTTTTPASPRRCRAPGAAALGLADDFAFTGSAYRPADQVLLHRAVLAGPPDPRRRRAYADHARPGAGARPRSSTPRRARSPSAGHELLQIDEPFLAGYPEHVAAGRRGDQHRDRGHRRHLGAARLLRQPVRPAAVGRTLRLPVPGGPGRRVDQLVLEFARKGYDDLPVIQQSGWDRDIGLGVSTSRPTQVESPDLIATASAGRCAVRARRTGW